MLTKDKTDLLYSAVCDLGVIKYPGIIMFISLLRLWGGWWFKVFVIFFSYFTDFSVGILSYWSQTYVRPFIDVGYCN